MKSERKIDCSQISIISPQGKNTSPNITHIEYEDRLKSSYDDFISTVDDFYD